MPSPPRHSPATGNECPVYFVHSDSPHFRDIHGRVLLLRGVNLSSSAKTPVGHPLEQEHDFWDSAECGDLSFVGRVLDIDNGDADVHLSRLRSWGYNCVRYVTVWEAIEYAGPGKYDMAYLDYTVALLRKCKEYGFRVVMDPHQDLFSRFSGGSGAPYWALLACGFNPRNFTPTRASIIECEWKPSPSEFPSMIWATNYERLAAQTLTTLFFAGRHFSPKCIIDGVNIQDWLQTHFINAFQALANHIADAGDLNDECVIGWDSINEPNHGFVNIKDLDTALHDIPLQIGPSPTPLQGFRLGLGESLTVNTYKFGPFGSQKNGSVLIDPKGKKAWLENEDEELVNDSTTGEQYRLSKRWGWKRDPNWKLGQCLWAQHGVWDPKTGKLLRPDYFVLDKSANFVMTYWVPFWLKWAQMIRQAHPEAIHFIHTPVFAEPPSLTSDTRVSDAIKSRAAMSYHYYDGLTLVSRKWNWYNFDSLGYLRGKYWSVLGAIRVGEAAIRKSLRDQLRIMKNDTPTAIGSYPSFIGEIGIPYDLDGKKAYGKDGDYSAQSKAWDASMNALDGDNALNYTMWCYCPDNSHKWGDHWNGEDLSIWSRDDVVSREKRRQQQQQYKIETRTKIKRCRNTQKPATVNSSTIGLLTPDASSSMMTLRRGSPASSMTYLGGVAARSEEGTEKQHQSNQEDEDDDNYDNDAGEEEEAEDLNNGGRCLQAVCRPHPRVIVGTPVAYEYSIETSEFTFEVQVAHDDVFVVGDEKELATEIYVPRIHYGIVSKSGSESSSSSSDDDTSSSSTSSSSTSSVSSTSPPSRMETKEELSTSPQLEINENQFNDQYEKRSKDEAGAGAGPRVETSKVTSSYDLNVDVTNGRWELDEEEQILRWYYGVPSQGTTNYKITIMRAGGSLYASNYKSGGRENTWCPSLFDGKCVIQ